jgi:Pyruvate/2-oxoacid:ferredoxin oxidoreductase delta subunit
VTIMDAIIGMHGNGPQNGDAKKIGIVMAAEDPVALDVVASEIVGLRRDKMLTTVAAEEMGIGCTDPDDMSIGGESVEDCKVAGFVFPMVVDIMSLFPWFLRDSLRDWLTSRPVVDRQKCELCMVCANSCPARVITARNDKLQFDLKQCIRCFCCQEMCPQGAITIGAGPLAKALRL